MMRELFFLVTVLVLALSPYVFRAHFWKESYTSFLVEDPNGPCAGEDARDEDSCSSGAAGAASFLAWTGVGVEAGCGGVSALSCTATIWELLRFLSLLLVFGVEVEGFSSTDMIRGTNVSGLCEIYVSPKQICIAEIDFAAHAPCVPTMASPTPHSQDVCAGSLIHTHTTRGIIAKSTKIVSWGGGGIFVVTLLYMPPENTFMDIWISQRQIGRTGGFRRPEWGVCRPRWRQQG